MSYMILDQDLGTVAMFTSTVVIIWFVFVLCHIRIMIINKLLYSTIVQSILLASNTVYDIVILVGHFLPRRNFASTPGDWSSWTTWICTPGLGFGVLLG